jgi:hypothetical protein
MTTRVTGFLLLLMAVQLAVAIEPDAPTTLNEHLKVFEPLVGKTFRGEFADSTAANPKFDVSRWERAMNGQAVRILHSVNDGLYGGETIIMWDSAKKSISYWYFTTAGFHTEGTMEISGKEWTSFEKVSGAANGITEVKATSKLTEEGQLQVRSQYFVKGKWEKGHEINYLPAADATVKFK